MNKKLQQYYSCLIEQNAKYNLTAITDKEDVFVLHFEDSLLGADIIPKGASVIDIGAGAGFPGVPIKIMRDDIRLTLIDSVAKKVNFLNLLIELLDLNDTKAKHTRIEEHQTRDYEVCLARAVAPLNILCEYALPLLKTGGIFVAYKAKTAHEEITEAANALRILGGSVKEVKQSYLYHKGESLERNLIVISKDKPTPDRYPRGGNKPRLKPL